MMQQMRDFIVTVPKNILFHVNDILFYLKPVKSSSLAYFGKMLFLHVIFCFFVYSCHTVKCFLSNLNLFLCIEWEDNA